MGAPALAPKSNLIIIAENPRCGSVPMYLIIYNGAQPRQWACVLLMHLSRNA